MPQDVEEPIPPSAKPLAPYLRSRQDALRIRQALTLYLQSHIVPEDHDGDGNVNPVSTHLPLTVPINESVHVKRIPSEVSGVRREYLKALQENIATKREYNELSNRITSRQSAPSSKPAERPNASIDSSSSVNDYLALLRERRQYEKLQLFDLHLKELASMSDLQEEPQHNNALVNTQLDELLRGNAYGTADGSGDKLQALISRLERTVVEAKAKLAKEQNLLGQLKTRQATKDHLDRNKTIALHRTRDELVQWVEEKLAITASAENDVMSHEQRYAADTNKEETSQLIAERKDQIREQYAAYVDARKSLLDAVSLLSQPTRSAAALGTGSQPVKKPLQSSSPNDSPSDFSSVDVFRSVSEHILPTAKYQKSLALQRSYLAGMLTKEKTNIKHTLDRLSQESHLLPEYPILARQSKFKHITATSGSGLRQQNREGGGKPLSKAHDGVVEHAQAWAFAAEAARVSENDYVDQRIEHGAEMADTAAETLQQVYDLLHQERTPDVDDSIEGVHEQGSDIWTAEVQPRRPRAKRQNDKKQQARGPWSALNGRVGE